MSDNLPLVKAMAEFQSKAITLGKNSEGFGYKYVDLAKILSKCLPILSKLGICVIQNVDLHEGNPVLVTTLYHEDGGKIEGRFPIDRVGIMGRDGKMKTNTAQEMGSGITYVRRYALCAVLGLATDDDDAECLTRSEIDKEEQFKTAARENADIIKACGSKELIEEAKRVWNKGETPWEQRCNELRDIADRAEAEASQQEEGQEYE